ncbi:MAG: uroporphyrinogen decarboxylase family protein [Anaerolineae bacterium]
MATSRAETPFRWYVTCGMPAYATLAGVRFDRIFREAGAIVEAFTVGEPRARELFGPDVTYGGPGWAGISYGHANCLGSPLRFPEGSEVAHEPIYDSLSAGVAALHIPVDWANAGMMPFYLNLWRKLKRAFPDRGIPFGGFGWEGPITTAWELRGHDFFLDIHDDPHLCKTFLRLLTESIVDYAAFIRSLNGQPRIVERIGLYDDVASLIHPDQWPEMVLPYHEQYFRSQTSGQRHAHIENLTPDHLPYLDVLRLDNFDPSVVSKVTPRDLRDRCRVPFLWRLNAMQLRDLSCEEIRHFVFKSVGDGASGVFSVIARTMTSAEAVRKIHVFIDAAKDVERLLGQGCPCNRLLEQGP